MPLKNNLLLLAVLGWSLTLVACSSSSPSTEDTSGTGTSVANKKNMDPNKGRYALKNDKMPVNPPNVDHVPNATPKYEPYSRRGNKPYSVYGESYDVLQSGKGFVEMGRASWYGEKFHGYETSNGEPYDMYGMSGAHKTLPLPSYAKITNLENNKQVVIRINDRGPFHSDRILDLSYAAAYKLDMLGTGTTRIKLEVIYMGGSVSTAQSSVASIANSSQSSGSHYIQLVASKDQFKLSQMAKNLEKKYQVKTRVQAANNMYRLQLGPIGQAELADRLLNKVKQDGYPEGYMVLE